MKPETMMAEYYLGHVRHKHALEFKAKTVLRGLYPEYTQELSFGVIPVQMQHSMREELNQYIGELVNSELRNHSGLTAALVLAAIAKLDTWTMAHKYLVDALDSIGHELQQVSKQPRGQDHE